ncbi:MAG: hypothetical protein Q4P29_07300 [Tissierellia bacterium]|nr:hypothetical protein [Tissierellia bacterium]
MAKLALALQQRILQKPMKTTIEQSTGYEVYIIEDYKLIADLSLDLKVDVLLMEVVALPPWDLDGCLKIVKDVEQHMPDCMIVFLCDAKNNNLGKDVAKAKRNHQIDAFVFSDTNYDFLIATLQSLVS